MYRVILTTKKVEHKYENVVNVIKDEDFVHIIKENVEVIYSFFKVETIMKYGNFFTSKFKL